MILEEAVENIDDEEFKEMVVKISEGAKRILMQRGSVPAMLIVGEEKSATTFKVPDGHQEMAFFFINMVEKKRDKARYYIFITESWSLTLTSDDEELVKQYMMDPTSIADNPFKTERLVFHAASSDLVMSGHADIVRNKSFVDVGQYIIDEDDGRESIANVADLLLPMVQ